MTDNAHAFYEYCESILAQVEAAELPLNSDVQQLSGILRVVVHPGIAASDLPRILCGYKARAPQVVVEITVRDTRTDISAGGYDVGILPPHLIANTRAISRMVRTSPRILVASTSYLVSHGCPREAADLCRHSLMHAPDSNRRTERKIFVRKGAQTRECRMRSSLGADDSVLKSCAMASMGIALVPADLVSDALLSGALEHVLPDHTLVGTEMEL